MTTSQENITRLTELLNEEMTLTKRLAEIHQTKMFYQDELEELKHKMHVTRDGTMIVIENMDEDHLINTINMFIRRGGINSVPKKYLNEIKSRGLIDKIISQTKSLPGFDIKEEDEDEHESYLDY